VSYFFALLLFNHKGGRGQGVAPSIDKSARKVKPIARSIFGKSDAKK
jgi:hypothetical protein